MNPGTNQPRALDPSELRHCPRCGGDKPNEQFYDRPDGSKMTYCAGCYNALQVSARRKNPDRYRRILDYNNAWLKGHPQHNQSAQQRWRERQKKLRAEGAQPQGAGPN